MKIAHVALWTADLDAAAAFWTRYFDAAVGPTYASRRRPGFVSRFVRLPGDGAQIELMAAPWLDAAVAAEHIGWDHVAVALDDAAAVDRLAERCARDGRLVSPARTTGDGYYEAVIETPDGTRIEIVG